MSEHTQTALAAVARRESLDALSDRLAALMRWLRDDLGTLDAALRAVGPPKGDLAWQAGRYLLDRPGKRMRPLCTLLAARMGGRPFDEPVRNVAVACELVHAATLLHDDVIDQGETRRGVPAARMVYGNSASVLAGDHLLVDALRRVEAPPLRAKLLDIIAEMVEGEVIQLERRGRFEPDRDIYLRIVRGKTAALFRYALWAGGALGGLVADQLAAFETLGDEVGVAFQVVDDLLDLSGDPAVMGKSACADLREGKLTWPLILAAERDPALADRMRAIAAAPETDPAEAAALVADVRALGVLDEAKTLASEHIDRAGAALRRLPAGPVNQALQTLIEAVLRRCA